MSLPFMRNDEGFVTVVEGCSYNIRNDHSKYVTLLKAVKDNDAVTFLANCSEEKAIQSYINTSNILSGKVELIGGVVLYQGSPVHNTLTKRIIEFQSEDLPFEPLLRFMEKLYQNPSSKAVNELYDFLENKNLPITPEGDFLAYKMVKDNYWSKTSGKLKLLKGKTDASGYVFNGIGEEIECARNEVDDNRDNECSYGLHVGGLAYSGPGGSFGSGRTVIVRINPADVIAVPKDYNAQKARVCHYFVVEDYKAALPNTLSTSNNCDCSEECPTRSREDEEYLNTYEDYEDVCEECGYEDCECSDDDEADYEGMEVTSEQVRQGDEIVFIYEDKERFLSVEKTTSNIVHGQVMYDDPSYNESDHNYRNFNKSKMSDIYVVN